MAKVVFLQQDAVEWLGVMYLSAVLKEHGHDCEVYVECLEKEDLVDVALRERADVVAFSCLTSDFPWALERAAEVRRASDALVVFGGTHVTLNAEEAILNPSVDVVCRGEGENALLELAEAIDRGDSIGGIANLFVKINGSVYRNEIRPLVGDLDSLPFPDRQLYAKYTLLASRGNRPLHIGRGCPYRCTYCHNTRKAEIAAGKGKFVRWRSVDSVLAEVERVRDQCSVSLLHFIDDGFGVNREWLKAFLGRLMQRPGKRLVLHANMRADTVTDDLCAVFRDYGPRLLRLRIAVECGDETYRREVLGKTISNEDLIQAALLFRRHGISFATYNMVGLPGETLEQALGTVRLNLVLRPRLAICFVYQPYPGTDLADYALAKGFLTPETLEMIGTPAYRGFFDSKSLMRQRDIRRVENVHRIFGLAVRFPVLFPLLRRIVAVDALAPALRLLHDAFISTLALQRRLIDKY